MTLPVRARDTVRRILAYQRTHVLRTVGQNIGRADCVDVALRFQEAFEKSPEFDVSRKAGGLVERITAGDVIKKPLPYLRELGHAFHEMNLIEFPVEDGAPCFAAADLTAAYNMNAEKGRYHLFMVIASRRDEVLSALRADGCEVESRS